MSQISTLSPTPTSLGDNPFPTGFGSFNQTGSPFRGFGFNGFNRTGGFGFNGFNGTHGFGGFNRTHGFGGFNGTYGFNGFNNTFTNGTNPFGWWQPRQSNFNWADWFSRWRTSLRNPDVLWMIITGLIISIAVLIVAFLTLLFCIKTRRTRRNANRLRKLEESWNNNDPMSDQAAMLPVTTDLYNNNHTPPKVSSWRIRLLSRLPRRLRPSWIIDEELKQKMMARRLSPPMGDLGSRWDPHARWSGDGIICTKTDREGGGDKLSTHISFASLSMFENLAARTTTQGASSPLPSLPLAHTSDKSKRTSLSRISEQASIIGRPILPSQALAQANARKSRSSLLMGVTGNPRPFECQARLSLSEEMIRSDMLQYMVFNDDVRLSIKSSSVGDVETAQRATRHPATTIFRNSEMDSPTLPTFRVETRSNSISEQGNSKGGGSTRPTSIFAPYAFPSSTVIDDKVKPGRSSAVERAIFNSRY